MYRYWRMRANGVFPAETNHLSVVRVIFVLSTVLGYTHQKANDS